MNTKQTEIGEIPEDWEVVKLGEIAEVKSGGTPSTSNKDFWDGEIAWCTPTDITALKGGKYLTQTSRNITKSGLQYSAAELLPVDSIVMTSRATIGECAIAKSLLLPIRALRILFALTKWTANLSITCWERKRSGLSPYVLAAHS